MDEAKSLGELIHRLRSPKKISFIPRHKEPDKDPFAFMDAIGITVEDAKDIVENLSEGECRKENDESQNPKFPAHKWIFHHHYHCISLSVDIYIKISSVSPESITVESFHEDKF